MQGTGADARINASIKIYEIYLAFVTRRVYNISEQKNRIARTPVSYRLIWHPISYLIQSPGCRAIYIGAFAVLLDINTNNLISKEGMPCVNSARTLVTPE